MDQVKYIENLPDEILTEIFSYLTFQDLIYSVQHVCNHWHEVVQCSLLWKYQVYKPSCKESDSEIAVALKQAPKLQNLILSRKGVTSVVLNSIIENCPRLKKLKFFREQRLSTQLLKSLLRKCPGIEDLSVPNEVLYKPQLCEIIGHFSNLKSLDVSDWINENATTVAVLKPIADGCPSLESINLRDKLLTSNDLKYFLHKKGSQLHTLCVRWNNADVECNLPLLYVCSVLKTLHVSSYCEIDTEEGFDTIRSLRLLTSLTLSFLCTAKVNDVITLFQGRAMDQLKELTISYYSCYEDILANVIVENCPKLKLLFLDNCSNLSDKSVEKFYTLPCLQSINLRDSDITDVGMMHIAKCKNIKYLNLVCCTALKEESMKLLTDFHELRVLKLGSCNIKGLCLHLIPYQLRRLRTLDINYCKNMDLEAVEQLRHDMPDLLIHADNVDLLAYDRCPDSVLEEVVCLFDYYRDIV